MKSKDSSSKSSSKEQQQAIQNIIKQAILKVDMKAIGKLPMRKLSRAEEAYYANEEKPDGSSVDESDSTMRKWA